MTPAEYSELLLGRLEHLDEVRHYLAEASAALGELPTGLAAPILALINQADDTTQATMRALDREMGALV